MTAVYTMVVAALLCCCALAVIAHAKVEPKGPVLSRTYGCKTEDSCSIDYRGSKHGPVWIIKRVTP